MESKNIKPNPDATISDKEIAVQTVSQFKEVCSRLIKLKECTATDKKMLASVFSRIQLKINQTNIFE